MSKGAKYLLVSLPTSISPSNHADEALTALRSTITQDNGTTSPFAIPNFKIGTLDALVQQADDLSKLEGACESVVGKVGDSLRTLLDGNEETLQQHKTINDSAWRILDVWTWDIADVACRARGPVSADLPMEQDQVPGR
jgi:V-type H+-transporting ATPase subunit C